MFTIIESTDKRSEKSSFFLSRVNLGNPPRKYGVDHKRNNKGGKNICFYRCFKIHIAIFRAETTSPTLQTEGGLQLALATLEPQGQMRQQHSCMLNMHSSLFRMGT